MSEFLPFAAPDIGDDELNAVTDALRSGWLTTGPRVAQFEDEFKKYVGAAHALAVNSCTAGLHLALVALGIGPGDEVITTPLTFCATVNVILETGATAVLADIGPDLNIDPASVRRAITKKTRAILPVHIGGLACDMDAIWGIARRHNLSVVEDAAHASGSAWRGVPIGGGASDAVAFSFYATKNLSTGEGGMVVTPSAELHARMKTLCLHGISRDAWNRYSETGNWHYEVVERGFKYNMSDLVAAIGIAQLRKLDRMNARRAEIATAYNDAFREMPELEVPPVDAASRHARHLYILRLNLDRLAIDRAQFFDQMRQRGIGCSVHFIPIPMHPYYRRVLEMRDPCSRTMAEYPRLISLPLYSKMTDGDVRRVIAAVEDTVAQALLPAAPRLFSAPTRGAGTLACSRALLPAPTEPQPSGSGHRAKRLVDALVSAAMLLLLAPIGLLIASAVILDSGRPVFFRQTRVGRGFRRFTIWKFRSMRANAPGSAITAAGDPRITRLGRILRATKLDELPQFWNVLRGEMSLVGPRPEVPEYVEMYRERYRRILEVRPGITDLASVRFRGEEAVLSASSDPARTYRDQVLPQKLDLADEYLRRRSFATDLAILLQTFRVVLRNPGL